MRQYFHTKILVLLLLLSNIIGLAQVNEISIEDRVFEYESKAYDHYVYKKNLDSAEYYYLQALDLQIATFGSKTEKAGTILINLASVYKNKYDYKTYFECSNQAEAIFNEIDPDPFVMMVKL